MSDGIIIRAEGITKRYVMGAETVHALRGISLDIRRGQYVSIMGPSGSGKSTFFNIIGGLEYVIDISERVHYEVQLREQASTIREISTPAIQLWEGVVVLPVVGVIDSVRAQHMMDIMLTKIAETACKVIILDIQGVPAVDTAVANHLIKVVKATRLMGSQTIISGISPAVAQTIVNLGIDMGAQTTSTLRNALNTAFDIINCEVRQVKAVKRET